MRASLSGLCFNLVSLKNLLSWLSISYSRFCVCFIKIFRIPYLFQVNIQYLPSTPKFEPGLSQVLGQSRSGSHLAVADLHNNIPERFISYVIIQIRTWLGDAPMGTRLVQQYS